VLAKWARSDRLTLYAGWTQGWDTGFSNNGGSTFLGGFTFQITDALSFTYGTTMGDFGFADSLGSDPDAYEHSIVLDWQLTERLKYVLQSDYFDNSTQTIGLFGAPATIFTVNQYLLFALNDRWGFGGRFEWIGGAAGGAAGGEAWLITLGANYRPHTNLVIRPELRFEDFDPAIGRQDQTLFGMDAIFTY
jgi:hypothetical protein